MNLNTNKLNNLYNNIIIKEQFFNKINLNNNNLFKLKINFFLKNNDKNRFIFIVNLLLLERSSGQRVIFIKNKEDTPRIKPFKIGCSVSIRKEYLFNFWKMLIFFSFPKLHENIYIKNYKYNEGYKEDFSNKENSINKILKEKTINYINLNKFLFFACFSFSNDFDKFLLYYEDLFYYLSIEFYSGFHKFLLSYSILGINGLHII